MLKDRKLKDESSLVRSTRDKGNRVSVIMSPNLVTNGRVKNLCIFILILAMLCIIVITLELLSFLLPNEYWEPFFFFFPVISSLSSFQSYITLTKLSGFQPVV